MKNSKNSVIKPLRTVRSFVRREGRISPGQQKALDTLWHQYGVELGASVFNFAALFHRDAPCVLEIGFGMGQSLLEQAKQNPEVNYLGIEVHRPGVGKLLAELSTHQLTNVRVICADAVEVLQRGIPDNALTKVQIFFPDPWHKTRHHKRRLIQKDFVNLLKQKLISGGYLHLATDWENYAQHMLSVLTTETELHNTLATDYSLNYPLDNRPITKFELRGKKLGHQVWDLLFVKK